MELEIILTYCICDDLVKSLNKKEDKQIKMTDAEVMTTGIISAMFFSGNIEKGRIYLKEHGYIQNMLSKSELNRRFHKISEGRWQLLLYILSNVFKKRNKEDEYIADSFPVPVCDNIRIYRCKIYQGEDYRGFIASKKRYFYGLRVHMIVTKTGEPIEFTLSPGANNDMQIFRTLNFDLPKDSTIYADKAYNDYEFEDLLKEANGIDLLPLRKKNSKRPLEPWIQFYQSYTRKRVETSFSQITNLLPRKIHAVIPKGFELKIALFIIAFAITCL